MQKQQCCPAECPKAGDVYVCACGCGFTTAVLKDCTCTDCQCVALACCGQAMKKAN